jgi:hypothetical protein
MSIHERTRVVRTRREKQQASHPYVVGDAAGNIYSVYPGKFLVREVYGVDTFGPAVSVWGPELPFTLQANYVVNLAKNADGEDYIKGMNHAGTLSQGISPMALTQLATPGSSNNSISQTGIATLKLVAQSGMIVGLQTWRIGGKQAQEVSFSGIDLTSYVPAAGLMCYAVIGVLCDYSNVEIQVSTARAQTDVDLNTTDIDEAVAALSAGTTPAWAIKLTGGLTTIDQTYLDNHADDWRQIVNANRLYEFTPSGTADTAGLVGDIAWDDTNLYVKTNVGWKFAALGTF